MVHSRNFTVHILSLQQLKDWLKYSFFNALLKKVSSSVLVLEQVVGYKGQVVCYNGPERLCGNLHHQH